MGLSEAIILIAISVFSMVTANEVIKEINEPEQQVFIRDVQIKEMKK